MPITGSVKGGDDGYLVQDNGTDGWVDYWTGDPNAHALRIKGDSMHPRYRAGEFVVVTPSIEAQPGRDVVVKLTNGKCLLKQLNWVRSDEVQLLSINNGYAPMTIPRDEIESICRVAGSVGPDSMVF
ncbi:MAG: S24 family peptidase [Comamonas sp.]|uniref:S24 family peptidase n=1 Tax=Comamonas sp. TaxID=34028 RepID=UPI00281BAC96|nr:S24 family peptidase [Comamonas sp.]MDR0216163.1 S24 family peptidase [Comamonas sp.]